MSELPTIYLLFPDADTAQTEMVSAGYKLSEYNDHFEVDQERLQAYLDGVDLSIPDPNIPYGWGTLLAGTNGHEVNVYDAPSVPVRLLQFEIPPPASPNSVRAGEEI